MLTGESLPVEKRPSATDDSDNRPPIELENLCFMGTNVVSGSAKVIIVATGSNTYFGSIGKSIVEASPETSFDIGINKVSVLLIRFMLVMVPIQLLFQNLLYDFSQISLPWDHMDEDFLESPKKWKPKEILRFMLYIGPTSSIFDYALFAIMYFCIQSQ